MAENFNFTSKRTLYILIAIIALSVITIFGLFISKFHQHKLSDDPARWGAFGDYVGGTLNVIIGLANLYFLVYISFKLANIEQERNDQMFKKSIKPILVEEIYQEPGIIQLSFESCGLGPAVVDSFDVKTSDGKVYASFLELSEEIKFYYVLKFEATDIHNRVIPTGNKISILKVKRPTKENTDVEFTNKTFQRFLQYISNAEIRIKYTDILKSEYNEIKFKLPVRLMEN